MENVYVYRGMYAYTGGLKKEIYTEKDFVLSMSSHRNREPVVFSQLTQTNGRRRPKPYLADKNQMSCHEFPFTGMTNRQRKKGPVITKNTRETLMFM